MIPWCWHKFQSVSLTEQRSKLASPLTSKEGEDHLLSRQPQMDCHRASPPSGLNTGLFCCCYFISTGCRRDLGQPGISCVECHSLCPQAGTLPRPPHLTFPRLCAVLRRTSLCQSPEPRSTDGFGIITACFCQSARATYSR